MSNQSTSERVRTRPVDVIGIKEHYVGIGILCLTMLLCTWVLIRGLAPVGVLWGAYDSSLFNDQTAVAVAAPAVAPAPVEPGGSDPYAESGESSLAGYGEMDGEGGAPAAKPTGPRPDAKFLPLDGGGWQAGPVEAFTGDTMYEKINGAAEAYLAYDCEAMECCTYSNPADPKQGVDVYLYDQGRPLYAFGMLTSERSQDGRPEQLGQDGYSAAGAIFFWRDRYYCKLLPSNGAAPENAQALILAKTLDQAILKKVGDKPFKVPGESWFPTDRLVPHSITYVLRQALGQEFLTDTYTAYYQVGDKTVQAFLAERDKPESAATLLRQYREFLTTMGKVEDVTIGGVPMVLSDNAGMVDLVFCQGNRFGGVSYVEGREPAETVVKKLSGH